jgi:hypothetical protein
MRRRARFGFRINTKRVSGIYLLFHLPVNNVTHIIQRALETENEKHEEGLVCSFDFNDMAGEFC